MAATLRRTFRYPDDDDQKSDLNNTRQELDEEEQDAIIQKLHHKNDADNLFYLTIFIVLPLIAALAYVPALISSLSTTRQKLMHIFCILSLLATAYITESGSSIYSSTEKRWHDTTRFPATVNHRWFPELLDDTARTYLVYFNAVLSMFLAFGSWYITDTPSSEVLYILPGVLIVISYLAKRIITEVDIAELERLRYEYKGA